MEEKPYTYLIIEDDLAFTEILKVVAAKVPNTRFIGSCDNTVDAAKRIDVDKPDILLLDVSISGLEGPEILEIVDHKPQTIVVSSHPATVMDEYDIDYVAFIQKPLNDSEQLIHAMNACIERVNH